MTTRAEEEQSLIMAGAVIAQWHAEGLPKTGQIRTTLRALLRHYPTEDTIKALYARPERRDRIDTDEDPPLPGGLEGALPR